MVSDDSAVDGLAAIAAAQRLVSAAADVIHDLRFRHALAAVAAPQEEGVEDRVYAVERLMQCGVPVGRDDEMRRVGKLMAEGREGRFDRLERCHLRAAAKVALVSRKAALCKDGSAGSQVSRSLEDCEFLGTSMHEGEGGEQGILLGGAKSILMSPRTEKGSGGTGGVANSSSSSHPSSSIFFFFDLDFL